MAEIIVQKFGGTSVGSVERIAEVAKIIEKSAQENSIIVVVSAMSGETNRLIGLAKSFGENPNKREFDALVSTGEKVSASLLAIALNQIGIKAKSFSAAQISMKTTNNFSKAKILDIDDKKILDTLADGYIPIITGFQGITEAGDVTTLGRGGSDTTAVAIAASVKAKQCDIYTDVDGIYTTDPRMVPNAKKLDVISMEEMLEMAGKGAKVIQIRAVEFANKFNVPVRVLSSFDEGNGTLIYLKDDKNMENALVSGIAFQKDQVKITLHGVTDTPGIAYQILGPLSDENIEVDVIVQNVSVNGKTDFTFTVSEEDELNAAEVLKNLSDLTFDDLIIDSNVAKVSLVGVGMRTHAGVASTAFKALSDNQINIQMISTSEIKITLVIEEGALESAVKALHSVFELEK
jgi:aspartate kinase